MKPEGYPPPWCDALDRPYWQINIAGCLSDDGWKAWQAHRPMTEIIPQIDKLIERSAGKLPLDFRR